MLSSRTLPHANANAISILCSSSITVAYTCRYRAPIKLTYTTSFIGNHRKYLHAPPLFTALKTSPLSSYSNLQSPNLICLTGNSFFSRVERFWSRSGMDKNKGMLEQLRNYGVVRSKKVAEVMESVDRAVFVPEETPPYIDSPMSIGFNVTISAPHMHAMCLELLEDNLQPGMRALDIGSGTGYLTACFARMVGAEGHAVGVEHIPELVSQSIKNIERSVVALLLKEGSLQVHVGDGRLGWPELAPYDAIHVGAAAPEIPPALIEQLKPGGRLVIPVGNVFQELQVVDKNSDGSLSVRCETSVRYVPLTSRESQLNGS